MLALTQKAFGMISNAIFLSCFADLSLLATQIPTEVGKCLRAVQLLQNVYRCSKQQAELFGWGYCLFKTLLEAYATMSVETGDFCRPKLPISGFINYDREALPQPTLERLRQLSPQLDFNQRAAECQEATAFLEERVLPFLDDAELRALASKVMRVLTDWLLVRQRKWKHALDMFRPPGQLPACGFQRCHGFPVLV